MAQAGQGTSGELEYSVIQLYFHRSCADSQIGGARDSGETGALYTSAMRNPSVVLLNLITHFKEQTAFLDDLSDFQR